MPLSAVDDYAETVLAPQISQLPGIAQVLVYGAQKFAVRVQVDPVAAAARNISLDDIRTVVAKANSSAPVGTLHGKTADGDAARHRRHAARSRLPRRGGGLSQRRADQAQPGRARHRQRRERQDRDLVQRFTRHRAGDPAPARRQHRRSGGYGARQAAGDARADAAGDLDDAAVRPLAVDPRGRRQRAGDAGDRDLRW